MPIGDIIITILVLFGVFLLGYSSIRKQGLRETFRELKEIFTEKTDELKAGVETKYANI